jgi:hypothetical protein
LCEAHPAATRPAAVSVSTVVVRLLAFTVS